MREFFHLLVHSPNELNSRGCTSPKPGAKIIPSPMWIQDPLNSGHLLLLFQKHYQSWVRCVENPGLKPVPCGISEVRTLLNLTATMVAPHIHVYFRWHCHITISQDYTNLCNYKLWMTAASLFHRQTEECICQPLVAFFKLIFIMILQTHKKL